MSLTRSRQTNSTLRAGCRSDLDSLPQVVRAFAVALICGAAVAASSTVSHAQRGADLVVAVTSLPKHLDPMGSNSNDNERVSQNVVENLIFWDFSAAKLMPGLATAWRMLDATTMELDIRQGVKCHNGEDFTAEDVEVMFGPDRYNAENAPGHVVARSFLGTIADVKAIGTHTVRVKTRQPDPLLELRLASWMGQVPCADAYRAVGNWDRWGQAVVGTGPYKVDQIKQGEFARFAAFGDYWGEKALVNSFTLKLVPEMAARVAGLLAGELHIITEITPDQFKPINSSPATEIVGGPIANIRAIIYDSRHPVLKDVRVRRALNLAIDRKLITETIFAGRTSVPQGLQMANFGDMFIVDHKPTGYDLAQARKLLAEAGYKGEEIPYRFVKDYYTGEVATAQILQQMWKAAGLNVKLELVENWDQVYAPGSAIVNISNASYFPDPLGQLFRLYGKGGLIPSRKQWSNADFDAAGDDLLSLDKARRQGAARQILEIYEQDPPGTYLHVLPMFYGKRKNVIWTPADTAFMDFRAGNLRAF